MTDSVEPTSPEPIDLTAKDAYGEGSIQILEGLEAVLGAPKHPYTRALISAVPEIDPTKRKSHMLLPGDPPNPENIPAGCPFHPRCPLAIDICRAEEPAFRGDSTSRARCHLVEGAA